MPIWNDIRLAVRVLVRNRSFSLTALSALAIGIAANSFVFTLVNGLLVRDLPFRDPGRLVAIDSRDAKALDDLSGQLNEVCSSCHMRFWYPDQPAQ